MLFHELRVVDIGVKVSYDGLTLGWRCFIKRLVDIGVMMFYEIAKQMPEEERALILLVEESWALVSGGNDLQDLGVKAFLKIFEIAPGAVELFSFQGVCP